jgi:hypothetical protein
LGIGKQRGILLITIINRWLEWLGLAVQELT